MKQNESLDVEDVFDYLRLFVSFEPISCRVYFRGEFPSFQSAVIVEVKTALQKVGDGVGEARAA